MTFEQGLILFLAAIVVVMAYWNRQGTSQLCVEWIKLTKVQRDEIAELQDRLRKAKTPVLPLPQMSPLTGRAMQVPPQLQPNQRNGIDPKVLEQRRKEMAT